MEFIDDLKAIFGELNVITNPQILEEKSFDKSPDNLFERDRSDNIALVVVRPTIEDYPKQLKGLVRVVRYHNKHIVIRGGGSGVLGAAVPRLGNQTVIVDMTDIDEVVFPEKNEPKNSVIVGAGILGSTLEDALNSKGYTLGHFPASLSISTPGGWVSTRSSGQFSSRYGNIEDLVEGIEVMSPGGDNYYWIDNGGLENYFRTEGTTGIITRVKLRITRISRFRRFAAYKFSHISDGLDFLNVLKKQRQFMEEKGVYLSAVRLYDFLDWKIFSKPHKKRSGHSLGFLKLSFEKLMVRYPKLTSRIVSVWQRASSHEAVMVVVLESDDKRELKNSARLIDCLSHENSGCVADSKIARNWYEKRYDLNYEKLLVRFNAGIMVDTFECQGSTEQLNSIQALNWFYLHREIVICSHFGMDRDNFYAYSIFAGIKNDNLYKKVWDILLANCHKAGGLATHHHGIGKLKAGINNSNAPFCYGQGWYERYLTIKRNLDPEDIFNPGNIFQPR